MGESINTGDFEIWTAPRCGVEDHSGGMPGKANQTSVKPCGRLEVPRGHASPCFIQPALNAHAAIQLPNRFVE